MLQSTDKLLKFLTKYLPSIALCCTIGAILYFNIYPSDENTINDSEMFENIEQTEATTEAETIKVYITGEVKKPDVYSMAPDARLQDLIKLAGGLTDKAYTDNLNLAQKLEDGAKIVVFSTDNYSNSGQSPSASQSLPKGTKVNINTADRETLSQLDGISEKLADNIIDYRNDYGNFSSIEEIREVDGIGEVKFNKIKDIITVD